MGTYIYKRTREVLTIQTPEGPIKANVYRYAFKPYWEPWHDSERSDYDYSFKSEWERYMIGYYRRFRTVTENRHEAMEAKGLLSPYVILLSEEDKLSECQS